MLVFDQSAQNIYMKIISLLGDEKSEVAQIRAVLNCAGDSKSRPLLVLSCVSREQPETLGTTKCRTPCVYMAKRLFLPQLSNRWMVIA